MAFGGYAHLDSATGKVASAEIATAGFLLDTVPNISLTATGQTTLHTVTSGKSCIVTDIILVVTASSGFVSAAIIRVGKASSYNEWLALTTLTGLSGANGYTSLSVASLLPIHNIFSSTDVIKMDVQTGAIATTLTATAYVFGFEF